MRSIAVGLDLDEMFFEDKINEQYHNLRVLSYPPIKTSLLKQDGQARVGAHSGAPLFSASLLEGIITPLT
jgi:isopenicillin N synthase-like dioxygenase